MKTAARVVALACAIAIPSSAEVLSGSGTALIDGVIGGAEWAGAAAPVFTVQVPGGGTTDATLYVMNDATNLYFGLDVAYLESSIDLGVQLDASGDGETLTNGDDGIGCYSANEAARDNYRTSGSGPLDTSDGGTLDVLCAASTTPVATRIEMSHPLDSGDGHDIAVAPDDLLAFYVQARLFPGSVDSYYPGPAAGVEAQILIAPEAGAGMASAVALAGIALCARATRRAATRPSRSARP